MQTIIKAIQKAIEEGKVEYAQSKTDYKRAHRGLKYKWIENAETYKILRKQEELIVRCTELRTSLKIIAEFDAVASSDAQAIQLTGP